MTLVWMSFSMQANHQGTKGMPKRTWMEVIISEDRSEKVQPVRGFGLG